MLKIAVIQRFLPSRSRGGVGHFTHGFCNALAKRGHRVTVFSQDPAPDDARYGVVVLPAARFAGGSRLAPLTFAFQVARQDFTKFDVVHAQGEDQFIPRASLPPLVRTMHGSELAEAIYNGWRLGSPRRFLLHLYFYGCEKIAARRADAVVSVSSDTRRYYPESERVIPNGVEIESFAANGVKTPQPSVLFVGEMEGRKRGRLLLQVFRELVRACVADAELWLVCPEKVEGDGVRWFGPVDAETLARLYQQAWVFCLPSSYEGFGRPYVEAMAAGTLVVATENPGAREVLEEGRCGLIVPEERLGETLCRLLICPEMHWQYRARGLQRARSFAWDAVAEQYEDVYETVLRRRTARQPAL